MLFFAHELSFMNYALVYAKYGSYPGQFLAKRDKFNVRY